jgi:hypothetical protein
MAKNLYETVIDYANYMEHYEENIQSEVERFISTMPETPDVSDKITAILEEAKIKGVTA